MSPLPTIDDIVAASARLDGFAVKTPVLESAQINEMLGGRLLIKAECLQRTGSFKFRGAFNMISNLNETVRRKGVVAFSSGNHAQGVARAASLFGIPATIVMPSDAPQIKIDNTKNDGAEVVLYDRKEGNRVQIAKDILAKTGATLIPPYDAPEILTGQGTLGLELFEQANALDVHLDYVVGPCSGGGMIGGTATVFQAKSPDTQIYAVEPEGYDDTKLSLEAGKRIEITPNKPSLCDALLLEIPGEFTFEVNKRLLTGGLTASENETVKAIQVAFREFKIVVEPGGAVALAAALSGKLDLKGKNIGVICTGGNVDAEIFQKILADDES